jgi:DNA-binding MarR family transcriptional regulator
VRNSSRTSSAAIDEELEIKKHLLSVSLYGESISIISNALRLSTVIRSHAEKHALKEVGLSYTGFMVMWILWVWGDMLTTKLAESSGVANSTITGLLKTLEKEDIVRECRMQKTAEKWLFT